MARRRYYGWFDPKKREFRLSLLPPDAPVRPSIALPSLTEVNEMARRRRAEVLWHPPLTEEQQAIGFMNTA